MTEFFGKEGLDFLFVQAEVRGFGDELVEGGADLAAARLNLERGGLMGDIGAEAAAGFDETFPFEDLVDLGDGEGIDSQLRREVAHGGELFAVEKLAREDALLEQLRNTLAAIDLMVGHSVFERVVKEANDVIRQIESTR